MNQFIGKVELLADIRSERRLLEDALAGLSEAQMLQPGVAGAWSVKDILAHLVAWERRMLHWIRDIQGGKNPQSPASGMTWDDTDRLNEQIRLEESARSLEDVLEQFHHSYLQSLAFVENLTDEELASTYLEGWPEGPLWVGVASNTSWHYREHRESIIHWLNKDS